MFIKKLELKNFKRFTDLTIDFSEEKEVPKLVLLIGANGSGKSCVFDGFNLFNEIEDSKLDVELEKYYLKTKLDKGKKVEVNVNTINSSGITKSIEDHFRHNLINIYFTDDTGVHFDLWKKIYQEGQKLTEDDNIWRFGLGHTGTSRQIAHGIFYGRNAIKALPDLVLPVATKFVDNVENDFDKPLNLTHRDERLKSNFAYLPYWLDEYAKNPENQNLTFPQLKQKFYSKFSDSFNNVFAKNRNPLSFSEILPNRDFNEADDFIFTKGSSKVEYALLSMGEKLVVDIMLDIIVREKFYTDSIVYFDELDIHLHTDLQKDLMAEIMKLIAPLNSQVWVASHSLGFIEYTREYNQGVIIDLDNLDFDVRQPLTPKNTNDFDVYEIAVPKEMLATMLKGKDIYFCENKNAVIYNGLGLENVIFVIENDKDSILLRYTNPLGTPKTEYFGLIDRDYMTPSEVIDLKKEYPKIKVLDLYSIEAYLYHPENILEIEPTYDIASYKKLILESKKKNLVKMEIREARKKYYYFKGRDKQYENVNEIQNALNSDDFEIYYPYFDVKKYFSEKPNFDLTKLYSTTWFKNQIQKIIEGDQDLI